MSTVMASECQWWNASREEILRHSSQTAYIVLSIWSVLGIVTNTLFIVLIITGIRLKHISVDLYIILLNRTVSDLVSVVLYSLADIRVAIYGFTGFGLSNVIGKEMIYVSIWASNISYLVYTGVRYVAVAYPLLHRRYITNGRVVLMILVGWSPALVYFTAAVIMDIRVVATPTASLACLRTHCTAVYGYIWLLVCGPVYVLVLAAFALVYRRVRAKLTSSRRGNIGKFSSSTKRRLPSDGCVLTKLLGSILTFLVATPTELAIGFVLKLYYPTYILLATKNLCSIAVSAADVQQMHHEVTQRWWILLLHSVMTIRPFIDPIINIASDSRMRQHVRYLLRIQRTPTDKRCEAGSSELTETLKKPTEENQKCSTG